ncbi:LysR family transcriptional regulator [Pseudomonas gingeri]|uniref:LysR family transcriptional regulator n=1 Tax=Pseudomonas gingeri TaxID=117681 RepID=UPI0015A0E3B5|nr:LysR family transcriptional regulator [Pseudomonas gingeri]NWD73150.1 LysR family transcriptional regulator [Pseudomonas gingeri]
MNHSDFSALSVFARVAEEKSFTGAARALGLSVSSVSYTIRQIEQRHQTKLFNRTTRSVSLTEAGSTFLARVLPLMAELESAFADVGGASSETMGTLRLTIPPSAISVAIAPFFKDFLLAYPSIKIDLMVDNSLVDIVSKRYDAGIRYDHALAQDMVAIPLLTTLRFCVVASPGYLDGKAIPTHPKDLLTHECINYRSSDTDALYRWEFEALGEVLRISVTGRVATNDSGMILQSSLDGFGFAYVLHQAALPYLKSGQLVSVLDDWSCPATLYLYHYSSKGMPKKLRVFIDYLKARLSA